MSDTQKSSWSSAHTKTKDPQSARDRRRDYINLFLTIFLAAAVIIGGFVAPNAFYSAIDSERDNITVLSDPSSDDVLLQVFEEPVSLYPWSLYSVESTFELSYTERSFLIDHNVPTFLATAMTAYGMDVNQLTGESGQPTSESLSDVLVSAFSFLLTDPDTGQGCYVMHALDVNKDGVPDLRCAVDQNGVIISQIFLSEPWTLEGDVTDTGADATGADAGATQGNTAPPAGSATTGSPAGTDATSPTGDPATGATENSPPDALGTGTGGATADESETLTTSNNPYALNLDGYERKPVGEELSLWSYVHLVAQSAAENEQYALQGAAAVLDNAFSERYANPDTESENLTYSPTPIIFSTVDYLLYIYDLPTNVRFILYYDSAQSRCVGFNLQI